MPWLIDRSLLRAGRFSNWVFIKEPEKEERIGLFQHYLKGIPSSGVLDFHVLASRTGNFSTSRIKKICDDTCQKLFDESIDNDSVEFITQELIEETLASEKPDITAWYELAAKNNFLNEPNSGNGFKDNFWKN